MHETSNPAELSFSRAGEHDVILHWHPTAGQDDLSREQILLALEAAGYGAYEVDEKALDFLLASQHRLGRQARQVCIARRVPAQIQIQISPDCLKAWMTVRPGRGYASPTRQELEAAIRQQGLIYGLRPEALDSYVQTGSLDHALIAEGDPPLHGKSAWFEFLVAEPELHLETDAQGRVDYRRVQRIQSVDVNDLLMRRHPPEQGQIGRNVMGEPIPATTGRDYQLQASMGSALVAEDRNLLVATRSGRPIRLNRTVRVDDVLELDEVNYHTGHIHFKGSVIVHSSVREGFQVRATGDIVVYGSVEDAILESDSHVYIHGSMFGRERGRISAHRDIHINYVQSAEIDCLGNLFVRDGMFHCQARVLGDIYAGLDGGKGQLNGGEIWAGRRVQARIVGSNSSTSTRLSLGEDPQMRQKLLDIDQNLRYYKSELEQVVKSIIYIRTRAVEKATSLAELETQRSELLDRVNLLTEQVNDIREQLGRDRHDCELLVSESLKSGVKLRLAEIPRMIEEDRGPCRVYLEKHPEGYDVRINAS